MNIRIQGTDYKVEVIKRTPANHEEFVAIIVPCHNGFPLTQLCLEAIDRFSRNGVPYEVWVVDNVSSRETVSQLIHETKANLILNSTPSWRQGSIWTRFLPWHKQRGAASVANGVALELAAKLLRPRWMFVMHNDSLPVRDGWLDLLLSELDDKVRGAAFRQDSIRVRAMHQSGFVFDFSLFGSLGLTFMPQLPQYDAGDFITVGLRTAGYDCHIAPNVFNTPDLRRQWLTGHWLENIWCDVAFDHAANPAFLHFGRGTLRVADQGFDKQREIGLDEWLRLVRHNLLAPPTSG